MKRPGAQSVRSSPMDRMTCGRRPGTPRSSAFRTGMLDATPRGMRRILTGVLATVAAGLIWILVVYLRDIGEAHQRLSVGSAVAETSCGPIEYAERGTGPPVLVVHGAGGGFVPGLLLGGRLVDHGYRVIDQSTAQQEALIEAASS